MKDTLKSAFLSYVELQKSANEFKCDLGTDNPITIEAYKKANDKKRMVLDMLESVDDSFDKLKGYSERKLIGE